MPSCLNIKGCGASLGNAKLFENVETSDSKLLWMDGPIVAIYALADLEMNLTRIHGTLELFWELLMSEIKVRLLKSRQREF